MEFRILIRLFTLSILLLNLVSCTKEVQIDIPGYKDQMVIDGSIETGQPAIVFLSKTNNVYSETNFQAYLNGFISGATVVISDGTTTDTLTEICSDNLPPGTEEIAAAFFGIPVEQLANFHLCAYVSLGMIGQVGKTYSLKVIHNGSEYNATTQISQPTPLDSLFWKPEGAFTDRGFSWAKLSDPMANNDAYCWQVKYIGMPNFKKTFNPFFNDKFFNGKTFEFAYENPMSFDDPMLDPSYRGYFKSGDTIVVKLSKIGKAEYNFFEKKYNQIYSGGNPFSTPTNVPTNIQGGALGVWVGYAPWFDTLVCQ
ncbi:MAG: DUF4249 domain-containing protein [Crocinitomicaceae bacterium]